LLTVLVENDDWILHEWLSFKFEEIIFFAMIILLNYLCIDFLMQKKKEMRDERKEQINIRYTSYHHMKSLIHIT